jgi:hypothetical protein
MYQMKKTVIALLSIISLANCGQKQTENTSVTDTTAISEAPVMVGNDLDKHGCKGSAGYTWSVVRNECVRIFEVGIRLDPQDATLDQTLSAFAIASADSTQMELYVPKSDGSIVLKIAKENETGTWNDGNWLLTQRKGIYTLEEGKKIRYRSHL